MHCAWSDVPIGGNDLLTDLTDNILPDLLRYIIRLGWHFIAPYRRKLTVLKVVRRFSRATVLIIFILIIDFSFKKLVFCLLIILLFFPLSRFLFLSSMIHTRTAAVLWIRAWSLHLTRPFKFSPRSLVLPFTDKPELPENVTVSTVSDSKLRVSWLPGSDNYSPITGYKLTVSMVGWVHAKNPSYPRPQSWSWWLLVTYLVSYCCSLNKSC